MHETQLIAMREKAELAVAGMGDEQLRLKAFEVILAHLLGSAEPKSSTALVRREHGAAKGDSTSSTAVSLKDRILSLKNEQFFSTPRAIGEIKGELAAHGWHYPLSNLSGKLQGLARTRSLRRMKVSDGGRMMWKYSMP
jgi:hypothetical protein